MKHIFKFASLLIFVLYSSSVLSSNNTGNDEAIKAFKEHPTTQSIIKKSMAGENRIHFDSMQIGGQCGVAGCGWKALVSLLIVSNGVNPQTTAYTAVVTGMSPGHLVKPTIKFVDLNSLIK